MQHFIILAVETGNWFNNQTKVFLLQLWCKSLCSSKGQMTENSNIVHK